MEAAVGGQQAEGGPALVHIGGGGALEAGDVVAPEAEAGEAQGQPGPEGLGHGQVVGGAVAAPVDGEFLAAHGGAAGEEAGLAPAL